MIDPFEVIASNFAFLEDWEDRYAYLIDLGRQMERLPPEACVEANRVHGCASQVWLIIDTSKSVLTIRGDSDAVIVRGLVAVVMALYNGKTIPEALAIDAPALFKNMGLSEHMTPQRSNGIRAMIERIRATIG